MAHQDVFENGTAKSNVSNVATISVPPNFKIVAVDDKLEPLPPNALHQQQVTQPVKPPAPLGVLQNFKGIFTGPGFNMIFRPESGKTPTKFPTPANTQGLPNDNVLELNLTRETWAFSKSLGDVPNRGLDTQSDIILNGIPYLQTVVDVTNPSTGKADRNIPEDIHFEPGLFMNVPESTSPSTGTTISRMASIPHGTSINAQGPAPTKESPGPPNIPSVSITPFITNNPGNTIFFPAGQNSSTTNGPRLPQDLSLFMKEKTITQDILNNPNIVLVNANKGKIITKNVSFTVSTDPQATSGGTANISFLGPNALPALVTSTFWISTIQHKVRISPWKPGQKALSLSPIDTPAGALAPVFIVTPDREITAAKNFTVTSTQIQYSQLVLLNFAGLSWPHVSLATLTPKDPLEVPFSSLKETN